MRDHTLLFVIQRLNDGTFALQSTKFSFIPFSITLFIQMNNRITILLLSFVSFLLTIVYHSLHQKEKRIPESIFIFSGISYLCCKSSDI